MMKLCKRNTALTVPQFNELFESLQSVYAYFKKRRTALTGLYMYLMRMRTGWPYEDVANIFDLTTSSAQNLIRQMRSVLTKDFVPLNVNYIRTREDLIEHDTVMSNSLFDPEDEKKVMLACSMTNKRSESVQIPNPLIKLKRNV